MPTIYLSPSTQPYNLYVTGGSEQDFMNKLANDLEPYLTASGIQYVRKALSMSAANAITASNAGDYDLHLALHSNASPESTSGSQRGIIVFYNPASKDSLEASAMIAEELKKIYPLPESVRIEPSTSIGEVSRVTAPSAFLEIGYHDNQEDALWVSNHTEEIAESIATALADYFDLPFLSPVKPRQGHVSIQWGHLNIREQPNRFAPIVASAVNGTPVTIVNQYKDWYVVQLGQILGYAKAEYIQPN